MIYALHGLFGAPSDWSFLPDAHAINLLQTPLLPMNEWAKWFNDQAKGGLLVGYSLGGRLALHCMAENPKMWRAAIVISAREALTVEERARRLIADRKWANRMRTMEPESFFRLWNAQEVFFSTTPIAPDVDLIAWADRLEMWTLARQKELPLQKIVWIAGERDDKFAGLAPKKQVVLAPDAGHRVLLDAPDFVKEVVYAHMPNKVDHHLHIPRH